MKFDRFDTTTDEANLVLSAYTTFTKALFSSDNVYSNSYHKWY